MWSKWLLEWCFQVRGKGICSLVGYLNEHIRSSAEYYEDQHGENGFQSRVRKGERS